MFHDNPEGQTHSENDGCGIPEHNNPTVEGTETEEAWVESLLEELSYGGRKNYLDDTLGMDSAREILSTTIRAIVKDTRADERKKIVEVVKVFSKDLPEMNHNGCSPRTCVAKTLEDVLAKISQV